MTQHNDINLNQIDDLTQPTLSVVNLVRIEYPQVTLYVATSLVDIVYNGQTWIGAGKVGTIAEIVESTDLSPRSLTLTLTGVPLEFLAESLTATTQQAPVTIWFALFDPNDLHIKWSLQVFAGYIDQSNIQMAAESFTVALTVETRALMMRRNVPRRLNGATQRAMYPTDTGLNNLESTSIQQIIFPSRNYLVTHFGASA
jgi:hypothetical protein